MKRFLGWAGKRWGIGGAFLGLFFMAGCHPAVLIIPSYIQSVGIPTIKNQTSYYGLETTLTQDVIQQFQIDGRIPVADAGKADLVVKVTIKQYAINPIAYDPTTNAVQQYEISLVYDLAAVDEKENKTFLEQPGLIHSLYYYTPQMAGAISMTDQQAFDQLATETAQIIVRKVLEGY